jgi:thymidylate kinase
MLETKLILVEGFPGAGKSTTTDYLRALLRERGFACRAFLEEDDPHPIDCLDFEIKGLTEKMVPLWRQFVEQARDEEVVTIIESRLWQNTAFFIRPLAKVTSCARERTLITLNLD